MNVLIGYWLLFFSSFVFLFAFFSLLLLFSVFVHIFQARLAIGNYSTYISDTMSLTLIHFFLFLHDIFHFQPSLPLTGASINF